MLLTLVPLLCSGVYADNNLSDEDFDFDLEKTDNLTDEELRVAIEEDDKLTIQLIQKKNAGEVLTEEEELTVELYLSEKRIAELDKSNAEGKEEAADLALATAGVASQK